MTQSDLPQAEPASPVTTPSLKLALRRARVDDAERSGARVQLRVARLVRLEMLQDALQPLLAQVPPAIDMFDVALVPSADPRLFIDMVGFVEMGRDAHLYTFLQDTRDGRIRLAETESLDTMVEAITDYVARRLLERDKVLAADSRGAPAMFPRVPTNAGAGPAPAVERRTPKPLRWAAIAFAFLIDLLGAIAFFTILGAAGWYLWNRAHGTM